MGSAAVELQKGRKAKEDEKSQRGMQLQGIYFELCYAFLTGFIPDTLQGYVIYSVKQKLKQEQLGLPGDEIKKLKSPDTGVFNLMPDILLPSAYSPNSSQPSSFYIVQIMEYQVQTLEYHGCIAGSGTPEWSLYSLLLPYQSPAVLPKPAGTTASSFLNPLACDFHVFNIKAPITFHGSHWQMANGK
ncbi:hypothetical protein WN944_014946 [Citrus x changshan-huyou]|uniref:Uncharacterized protein n=1 Tax=Citrus x changshan-huyou TaxID=2935761 RepID=A0AAP0M9A2_9ROSI